MGTVKREKLSRRPAFGEGHREQLLSGHDFFGDAYGKPPHPPILDASGHVWGTAPLGPAWLEEEAREDWQEHRDELMTYWLQDPAEWRKTQCREFGYPEPGGPFTRPWGWWMFDAPEVRQVIGNDGTCNVWPPPRATPQLGAVYESQYDFLARHGLLTEAEIAKLDKVSTQVVE